MFFEDVKWKTDRSLTPCWVHIKITVKEKHAAIERDRVSQGGMVCVHVCVCVIFTTGGSQPGEWGLTASIHPITADPMGTLARQRAVWAKSVPTAL